MVGNQKAMKFFSKNISVFRLTKGPKLERIRFFW